MREVDPLICSHCGAEMKVIALLDDPAVIGKILRHLKLWIGVNCPQPADVARPGQHHWPSRPNS